MSISKEEDEGVKNLSGTSGRLEILKPVPYLVPTNSQGRTSYLTNRSVLLVRKNLLTHKTSVTSRLTFE